MDPKANGQLQKEWGWLIAAYLFLGGVGAGAYAIAALNSFLGKALELSTRVGVWIGFPALAVGSLCLLADLGQPARAVRGGARPGTSWIARGFWIILAFMVCSGLHLVIMITGWGGPAQLIAACGLVFAIGTMAYTGLLLGAAKGITFWRSGAVPVLFVVSALVTGHFSIMLGMVIVDGGEATMAALSVMGYEAVVLVVFEVLAILFYLHGAYRLPDARESATRLLANRGFVWGYFLLGLATPLALMVVMNTAMGDSEAGSRVMVAGLGGALGLLGGLVLRWAILASGSLPTWNLAGFQFRRHPLPRAAKPGVGLLPPS
jgi:formate-dependent nitrite reductase membrane component NrfD